MAQIHFIDGEKGGVGKSLFARLLVHYCLGKGLKFYLVDADRSNPDVAARYPDSHTVFFSEEEKKSNAVDIIFNYSLEKPVIVNLPSQIFPAVTDWIKRNGLIESEIATEYNIEVFKWFLCNGGHDSITLFTESAETFQGKVKHIFVKNYKDADEDDWTQIFTHYPKLGEVIKQQNIPQLILPKFSSMERNLIDQNQWTFAKAIEKESGLPILSKQRVVNYLKNFSVNIEELKILTAEGFQKHSAKPKKPAA